jgi:hypothetical protein
LLTVADVGGGGLSQLLTSAFLPKTRDLYQIVLQNLSLYLKKWFLGRKVVGT